VVTDPYLDVIEALFLLGIRRMYANEYGSGGTLTISGRNKTAYPWRDVQIGGFDINLLLCSYFACPSFRHSRLSKKD
jgi:hypothetical protein